MENGPFEDVIPNGDIPASYVSLPEGKFNLHALGFAKPAWLLNWMDPKEMPSVIMAAPITA